MVEEWKRYNEQYEVSSFGNVRNKNKVLKKTINAVGYEVVGIKRETKAVHQLVAICFLNHTPCGYKLVVDHIDDNKLNNRLDNLQIITQRLNTSKNRKNKSGFTGVYYCNRKNRIKRFRALITINGKHVYLGYFKTELEASEAYQNKLKTEAFTDY